MHKKTSTVISSTRNMSGGFTLIELMIVVTIIAIISAIAVPSYNNYVLRAKRSEGRAALMDVLRYKNAIILTAIYMGH